MWKVSSLLLPAASHLWYVVCVCWFWCNAVIVCAPHWAQHTIEATPMTPFMVLTMPHTDIIQRPTMATQRCYRLKQQPNFWQCTGRCGLWWIQVRCNIVFLCFPAALVQMLDNAKVTLITLEFAARNSVPCMTTTVCDDCTRVIRPAEWKMGVSYTKVELIFRKVWYILA